VSIQNVITALSKTGISLYLKYCVQIQETRECDSSSVYVWFKFFV